MKFKTLNGLFAATAFSIMFANAAMPVNAEELKDESAVISEQEGQQGDGASDEGASSGQEEGNGTEGKSQSDNEPGSDQGSTSLPETGAPVQNTPGGTEGQPGENITGQQPADPANGEPSSGTADGEQASGPANGEQSSGPANGEPSSGAADGEPSSGTVDGEPSSGTTDSGKAPDSTDGQETEDNSGQGTGDSVGGQAPDQNGAGQAPSGSDSGQPSIQPDSGTEGEDGTDAGTEEDGKQQNGPADFEEAKENLDKAKEDEEQAKSELDEAQAGADSARDDVDKAQQQVQEAEKELEEAQGKKEEAEKNKNEADAEASRTEQELDTAQKELDSALQDANVNKDDFEKAQEGLEDKKKQEETAQQAVDQAQADYDAKKAEAEAAAAAAQEAAKNAESAENDKNAADQAVADAQKEADSAREAYENALNASGVDGEAGNAASENLKKAQEVLDAVKKKIASGSLGFFQYLGEAGSDSAKVAATILTAADASQVQGVRDSGWAAGSWEEFASYTQLGEEKDATSLENMKRTIAFMKECNELRTADNNFQGLSALQVNDALMAIAQLNANWATWTENDTYNTHSRVFNIGENLAWYYVDVPGMDDPFKGWYHEEKAVYDKKENGVTGHYINITDASYSATGFAVNISEDSRGELRLNCAQEFSSGGNVNYYGYGPSYSVEEYENRFMAYYNAVMKELSDAQSAYDAALAAYNEVIGGTGNQNQALIDSKKAELDKATDNLEEAKINAEEKLEILTNAQEALAADMEKNASAQAAFAKSGSNLETAQNDLQAKKEAYEAARKDIEDNFGLAVVQAAESLMRYKAEHNRALEEQSKAASAFEEAEAVWAAALDRKVGADRNLQEKTDILALKLQVLQDARNAYEDALAKLNVAQGDYDRLKPGEEASSSSYGGEITNPAAAQENTVAVLDLSAIDSRKATFSKGCSFKYFLNYTMSFVRDSSFANLTVDCSDLPWYSFNRRVLETLRGSLDKALTVVFRYQGRKYTFTIPSGFDLNLLQDSNGWYGFMYLKMIFGGHEVV